MVSKKINVTKNYGMFGRSDENRPLALNKHRKLRESMKRHGFLSSFPIVCRRDSSGHLTVIDGQHRLAFAQELGLPVYWTEEEIAFDVALFNAATKNWAARDYAQKYAAQGLTAYNEGLEFADVHHLSIGQAFALLAGVTSYGAIESSYKSGAYVVKDRKYADSVAAIYVPLKTMGRQLSNASFIGACMAICRVKGFDPKRLLRAAERCREKLMPYSTRDAYLAMLEDVYNFGQHAKVGLKAAATMAMRDRNPIKK